MPPDPDPKTAAGGTPSRLFVGLLLSLILFRIVIQIGLYRAGFQSLTADEFSRAVISADWARSPYLIAHGVWHLFTCISRALPWGSTGT